MHAKQNTEPLLIFNFFSIDFVYIHYRTEKQNLRTPDRYRTVNFFKKKLINEIRWWMSMPIHRKLESVIDWLSIILRSARDYFFRMETSPLAVKGCTNLGLCSAHISFEHRGILNSATSVVTRGPGFWRNHPKHRHIKSAESPEAPPH